MSEQYSQLPYVFIAHLKRREKAKLALVIHLTFIALFIKLENASSYLLSINDMTKIFIAWEEERFKES